MSVLVLGGAGYIGSHTVRELMKAGRDVLVADNLSTGFRQAVDAAVRFYELDIRDRQALDRLFAQESIDCVIHFAASSQVGESMQLPLKYYENNLCGTTVLLQSMVTHGVNKLVFSSSAAVYGEPRQIPVEEGDSTTPTNCYGQTKLAAEQMMKWADKAHGLRYVALRYFNASGADAAGDIGEAHDPETHLIPLVLQVANGRREGISIFGTDYPTKDGTCVRDYIHVTDLAQAHILAMEYLMAGNSSDVFNLGSGEGFTVKEVIQVARKVTGHPIPAKLCDRRAGDPVSLVASAEKARKVLGWDPRFADLHTIVSSAWKWHSTHPNGYGK